jgi:hypothetical protein
MERAMGIESTSKAWELMPWGSMDLIFAYQTKSFDTGLGLKKIKSKGWT